MFLHLDGFHDLQCLAAAGCERIHNTDLGPRVFIHDHLCRETVIGEGAAHAGRKGNHQDVASLFDFLRKLNTGGFGIGCHCGRHGPLPHLVIEIPDGQLVFLCIQDVADGIVHEKNRNGFFLNVFVGQVRGVVGGYNVVTHLMFILLAL
jgi:hypothetical protein